MSPCEAIGAFIERTVRRDGPLSTASSSTATSWRAERRAYFNLLRAKRQAYWTERVDADQSHPCRLWRSFDELLGRGRAPPPDINASDLHRYFDDKVAGVRAATSGADSPLFTPCPSEARLSRFVQYNRRRL